MSKPKSTILVLLALFTAIVSIAEAEESGEPTIVISGIAKGADGQYFAIARKYGILKKGDIIPISTETESFTLKITAIDQRGLSFQKLDVKKKAVRQPPPEPKKTTYEYRDPFWPIGYEPQGCQLLQKDQEEK
jgi:hypothetical protein